MTISNVRLDGDGNAVYGHTITEGASAIFTVTASPTPDTDLRVRISVRDARSVARAGQVGTRSVTIAAGSTTATLPVATVNDSVDEPDSRITATIVEDSAYTIGSLGTTSIVVTDDDDPPPAAKSALSISARASSVTEGGVVEFTVTASPAPRLTLTVWFDVTESGNCTATSQTGRRGVYLYGGGGTQTLRVHSVDDSTDEPDCTITATIAAGTDYSIGSPSTATATVVDNDATPSKPIVRVARSSGNVTEGGTATFTISAWPAPGSSMTVSYYVQDDSGVTSGGGSYSGSVTIPAGGTSATVSVSTVDDSTDDDANNDTPRPSRFVALILRAGTAYDLHEVYASKVWVKDND